MSAAVALPGTFLRVGETLADAVDRSLRKKANVRGLRPRQLHVFDDPHRDYRGWVLSVAHVDVVRPDQLASGSCLWENDGETTGRSAREPVLESAN